MDAMGLGSGASSRLTSRVTGSWLADATPSRPSSEPDQSAEADAVVRTGAGLRFRERICVYDTELIPNSIIYPI